MRTSSMFALVLLATVSLAAPGASGAIALYERGKNAEAKGAFQKLAKSNP